MTRTPVIYAIKACLRLSSEELASGPHRLKKGGGKKEQRLDDPRSRELASETPASASPRQINAARQSNRSASAALRAKLRERSPPPRGPYVSSHLSRRRKGRNDTFAGSCSKFYQFNIVSHTSQTTQRDAKKKVQAEIPCGGLFCELTLAYTDEYHARARIVVAQ